MRRFLRIYLPFSKAGIQEMMAYRFNFFFHLIGEMLSCFVMYFVWLAVFESSDSSTFMGFSMIDMTVYLFISFTASFLTYSDGAIAIGEEIRDGSIVMRMIKPVNFDMYFLFHELGSRAVETGIVLAPMCIGVELYKFCVTGTVMFSLPNFSLFLVSVIIAYLISFYFNVCYGFLAFFLKNLWGSSVLKDAVISFLSGSKIPLAFMPPVLSAVLSILPFASLSYTPVMLYMGMYDVSEIICSIALQLFWLIFFWALSKLIWRIAMKRLCVQGG
ncbi:MULTISPECIES: ABC-2 family transporter protein [unclassified Ruminococcus]|uniref:ABC transporter permease n=1 Tax=unclassified Ruminococcus TaxID=2608920 RepID=UPI00210DB292|nr:MULTISPECIES: ABC-2 family transporter protein [unclassified Ruminococcus]MCQ4021834.1 ABC transporter permease [Ruminococcus sp. zg-924]MCQ4114279.1 ABC transporter permease [Ruminococcus sp. zg-921]